MTVAGLLDTDFHPPEIAALLRNITKGHANALVDGATLALLIPGPHVLAEAVAHR